MNTKPQKRDLSKRYVYFCQGSISRRLDHDKQCMLVIIAADALGHKDIVGAWWTASESAQLEGTAARKRWGLKRPRWLSATAPWASGRRLRFTRNRCWVRPLNVLNQMKSLHAKGKGHSRIWMAETKADAEQAFDFFIEAYGAKYDQGFERLMDRERRSTISRLSTGNTSAPPTP